MNIAINNTVHALCRCGNGDHTACGHSTEASNVYPSDHAVNCPECEVITVATKADTNGGRHAHKVSEGEQS